MTSTVMAGTAAPAWSSRPHSDADLDAVLALFTEPDFFFRTAEPDTRPAWEIERLLGDDTRLLLADGRLIGLYAVEGIGSDHACHHQLHLRLHTAAPTPWWHSAYAEIVRALNWSAELVRLTLQVGDFDTRGLEFARLLGLLEEGTLPNVVRHDGRRHGYTFFSQIWKPSS